MSKTSPRSKKTQTVSKPIQLQPNKARKLELPQRQLFKPRTWLQDRPEAVHTHVPKARLLLQTTLGQLWTARSVFLGIIAIYGLLNLVLAQNIQSSDNLAAVRQVFDSATHGLGGKFISGTSSFAYLLTNTNSSATAVSGLYQSILFIIFSLAIIWTLRQISAGRAVKIRDGFYNGMYPLIPFLLMFLLLGLQFLPLLVGGAIYSYAVSGQVAVVWWEQAIFVVILCALALWTFRMITGTLFAFYAVTLPDMTPMKAYKSTSELVAGRRLFIWRKLIFLPFSLLLLAVILIVPMIVLSPSLAVWAFFLFSTVSLPLTHGYLYNLYRTLL